jgi:HK97 gp10 family phage protein
MSGFNSKIVMTINGKPLQGVMDGNEMGVQKACIAVAAQAKLLAPVADKDGGLLRNSIMTKTTIGEEGFNDSGGKSAVDMLTVVPKKSGNSVEGYVGSNASYATYQEFGTKKMAPQPFLRPAVSILKGQSTKSVMNKIMVEQMLGALKKGQKRVEF